MSTYCFLTVPSMQHHLTLTQLSPSCHGVKCPPISLNLFLDLFNLKFVMSPMRREKFPPVLTAKFVLHSFWPESLNFVRCNPTPLCLQGKSASSTFHKCWHDPGIVRREHAEEEDAEGRGCTRGLPAVLSASATPPPPPPPPPPAPLHCVLCDLHACLVFFV